MLARARPGGTQFSSLATPRGKTPCGQELRSSAPGSYSHTAGLLRGHAGRRRVASKLPVSRRSMACGSSLPDPRPDGAVETKHTGAGQARPQQAYMPRAIGRGAVRQQIKWEGSGVTVAPRLGRRPTTEPNTRSTGTARSKTGSSTPPSTWTYPAACFHEQRTSSVALRRFGRTYTACPRDGTLPSRAMREDLLARPRITHRLRLRLDPHEPAGLFVCRRPMTTRLDRFDTTEAWRKRRR